MEADRVSGRIRLLIGLAVWAAQAGLAGAAVTLTAARSQLLLSSTGTITCSDLHQTADDGLPLNVVRLRAAVDSAAPGLHYKWSLPRPSVGSLAADLDLGPEEETAAVRGLCAEFGNACLITEDKLPFYDQPTILYVAPKCDDVLPTKTALNFSGGVVRVGVSVLDGRQRLGKQSITIEYGRPASIELFVDGHNGRGSGGGVPSDIQPFFGAVVTANGLTLPANGMFEFDTGQGGSAVVSGASCSSAGRTYDACINSLLYDKAGDFTAVVKDSFDDGSALCDNITVRVQSATVVPRLQVTAVPASKTYVPGDPVKGQVNFKVTLRNASPTVHGSGILLVGSAVLTCDSELKVGGIKATRSTSFDLQHCSDTTGQACAQNSQCRPPFCPACGLTEFCLTQSHCATTLAQPCSFDVDCKAPGCSACQAGETCVRVLNTPSIVVPVGGSTDLVDTALAAQPVSVMNQFPGTALITDKWTVNTFNAGSASTSFRYRIRGTRAAH